jgi:hypothetical protein
MRRHRSTRGILLLEVSVALVVVSVGVIWMLRGFSHTILELEVSRDHYQALQVAHTSLLEQRVFGWAPIVPREGTAGNARWAWSTVGLPRADEDSQLLDTSATITWKTRDRERTTVMRTWLPPNE